ncbi:FAD-dependent oxidoreductase [Actinopolymorpha pittospori]|uniref:FAD dependent oxidoreductase n=1 Tax=Actinopolymorpha pittospori TaxID=648752 RepID=A0A927N2R5_9ACTN|nr:FAD-dependent oxidoreductase [Actinopolymorpha pittospori]MBE1611261.1 hypothetical protein [Actinopolymorpha pittospori]
MSTLRTSVLVVGAGLGGVACALTAARLGHQVILTEETDWLGGQLTSQAVPPDENPWIERHGSASYRRLREGIRDYYRRCHPLRPDVAADPLLNPGLGFVSPLCHEPRVAVAVLEEMLAPYRTSGTLTVLLRHRPVAAASEGDIVRAVTLRRSEDAAEVTVEAAYVVDATELGDLLDLAGVEHVIGAEAVSETGEPHATPVADPLDQQAISWCFPLEYAAEPAEGSDAVIDRPASYDHWRTTVADFWPGPQLSWTDVEPITLARRDRRIFEGDPDDASLRDLWHYRRIVARSQFRPGTVTRDVTLVNWPQIDYWNLPLLGVDDATRDRALLGARELSLSFLYWMQTEAPRPDGGTGYPGLALRPDIVDTADGLAKAAYVRESRRILSEFTVTENHVGVEARGAQAGSALFHDSVGIGSYRIDLHPSTAGRTYVDIDCFPFQIPLGSLLPRRVENLLPANKNIGTTHITNGCYRLHPVEWSIGEAVGALVAYCLAAGSLPRQVRAEEGRLADYRRLLGDTLGVSLAWPEEVRTTPRGGRPREAAR